MIMWAGLLLLMSLIRNEEAIELHTTDYNGFARIWEKNYLWGFDRIWELKSCVRGKRREVASCLQSNPKSFLPQTFNCQLPLTLMHRLFNISHCRQRRSWRDGLRRFCKSLLSQPGFLTLIVRHLYVYLCFLFLYFLYLYLYLYVLCRYFYTLHLCIGAW